MRESRTNKLNRPHRRAPNARRNFLMLSTAIFLYFLCGLTLFAQDASSAQSASESGSWEDLDTEKKIEWLAAHPDNERFYPRLEATLASIQTIDRSISLIDRFLPLIESKEKRYRFLLELARLEESSGEIDSAQIHYQSAASLPAKTWDYEALFSSAILLIELGEYEAADVQLQRIGKEAESPSLRSRARVHRIRIDLLKGEQSNAESELTSLFEKAEGDPRLYYLIYTLALRMEMRNLATKIKQRLVQKYPGSPETGMVTGLVERATNVEEAFGLLQPEDEGPAEKTPSSGESEEKSAEEDVTTASSEGTQEEGEEESEKIRGIQTGSFRDRENAEYMVKELKKRGFTTRIEEAMLDETEYHRVIVEIPPNSKAQKTLITLKQKGFEGIPVY